MDSGTRFCVDQSKSSTAHTASKLRCWLLCWTVDVSALCFSALWFAWLCCAAWQSYSVGSVCPGYAAPKGWIFPEPCTQWCVVLTQDSLEMQADLGLVHGKTVTVVHLMLFPDCSRWILVLVWQISGSGLPEFELVLWVAQETLDCFMGSWWL